MNYNEAKGKFRLLFENSMSEEEAKEFLIDLYNQGESVEDITAGAEVMREYALRLPVSNELQEKLIDNCGTGGDKSGSFNISTTVSFVLASCGCFVAKHGNRSITSKSGSADVLEELGINLSLPMNRAINLLEKTGFTFIFAQNHHPAMKYIMPIRKSLPHRTIFNILGPLTNPAGVKKQLIGVFDKSYVTKIAYALKELGSTSAFVVSSEDGLDEVSISAKTHYAHLLNGEVKKGVIDPTELGFKLAPLEEIKGGDAKENAQIIKDILENEISGAKRDIVVLNSALALVVDGKAKDIKDGIKIANEAIILGKAKEKLEEIIKVSNQLS